MGLRGNAQNARNIVKSRMESVMALRELLVALRCVRTVHGVKMLGQDSCSGFAKILLRMLSAEMLRARAGTESADLQSDVRYQEVLGSSKPHQLSARRDTEVPSSRTLGSPRKA